jgi:hypothetical protein
MEKRSMKTASIRLSVITTVSALLLLSTGCSDDPAPNEQTDTETSSPEMVKREAPADSTRTTGTASAQEDFSVVPDVSGRLEQEGAGLDTVIDASSKQAYAESLRWIAEDASQEQMRRLERSIRFIHMYDPTIYTSEQRLMDRIDGMTGAEIIELAREMQQQRESERTPIEVPKNLLEPQSGTGDETILREDAQSIPRQ